MRHYAAFLCVVVFMFPMYAEAGLREDLHAKCMEKRFPPDSSDAFCGCMTGKPYDAFLYEQQYGDRDKLIAQQEEMLALMVQEPGMYEARVDGLCGLAGASGNAQAVTQAVQKLKEEYTSGTAGQQTIRAMFVNYGYCGLEAKIEKATERAESLGSVEDREIAPIQFRRLYNDFIKSHQAACR